MINKQTILLVAILGMVFLSSSTVNAQLCDDTRCKTCTQLGVSTCDVCLDGYKLVEGKCTECADNYTKVSPYNSRCVRCTDSNCRVCKERDICTQCSDLTKFTLQEGKCQDVDPQTAFTEVVGCEFSQTQMGCDRCNTNRVLAVDGDKSSCNCDLKNGFVEAMVQNVSKCTPCTLDRCNSCTLVNLKEQCSSCEAGYTLDSTKTKCVCALGYGLDLTNTVSPAVCKPCSVVGCSECAADRAQCSKCSQGLNLVGGLCQKPCDAGLGYAQGKGECSKCLDPNCADCGTNNLNCKTCKEKTILFQEKCTLCDIANCNLCMAGNTGLVCQQCNIGFVADESRLKCNASTVTCEPGQGLNISNACEPCKVVNCTGCSKNSSACEICKDGFKFNASTNLCEQLPVECAAGQGKDITTGRCVACVDKNCGDCQIDHSKCVKCNAGLGFNIDKFCETCSDTFCTTCPESNLKCQACQEGYNVNNLGKCELKPTTCADGTGLNVDKICQACSDPNCAKCAAAFGTCEGCKVGFSFNADKQCASTTPICQIDGCSQCQSETVCGVCKIGFFSHLGKCVQACPEGFGPESETANICVKCDVTNCATCPKSFKSCLTCVKGFNIDILKQVCNVSTAPVCQLPNCSECDNTTGVCKVCISGFSLGQVNGKQVCYQGTDKIQTPDTQCRTLIPNCGTCSFFGDSRDIICDQCILGEGPCKEGNFLLKKDANFSNCARQFEQQECKMEGCLKCLVRVSFDATCPKELPQCLEASADYQTVLHNGQRIAVLRDLTQYNNIDLKSPIPNCSELSIQEGRLVCKTCVAGFLVGDLGGCRLNDCFTKFANCKVCETTCKECAFGFALSSTGTCVQSKVDCSTIPGCTVCKNDLLAKTLVCGACSEGFVLKENKCVQCADCVSTVVCNPNCGSCLNEKECTTCANGFINAPFCNQCEKKDLKFIPEKFACVPRCFPPQVFNFQSTSADNECITPSIQNCLRFATLTSGALSCNQCIEGFGVEVATAGNTCKACSIKGCLNCKFDNTGKEFCGACVKDLTLRENACVTVTSDGGVVTTPVAPAVCEPANQKLSNCSQCYFKENLAICAACTTGFQLSNRGTCTQTCTDIQYLNQDGICADCKLSFCAKGCFLSTSASKEIAPSVVCRDNLCIDGYYFDKEKMSCVVQPTDLKCTATQFVANGVCRDCPKGCTSCSSLKKCSGCIEGFTLDTVNGMCFIPKTVESVKQVTCLTNCAKCETAAFCLACQPGYLLSEKQNECVVERTSCATAQFLRNNLCVACSEISKDCLRCVAKEGQGVCTEFAKKTECAQNEMKIVTGDSFICRADKTCLQFDAQNNCLKCLNGSVPVPIEPTKPDSRKICNTCVNSNAEGACITCPKNCLKCKQESTTQIVCLPDGCDPRFELRDGVCVEKPRACDSPLIRNTATNRCECPFLSQFNSAGVCECIEGLVWNANKTQGCKKPEASDCEAGFRKDADGKCVACSNRIIIFNDDGSTKEDYSSQFCEACSGDTCDLCREGSFLIKEKNVCHQCDVGCAHCADLGKCLRCNPGKLLNNGKCSDTCDAGTLPSVKSYFTMNKSLFSSQANTEIYQKTAFKADTSITSLEKCGDPIAVGEYTFCSLDANVKLPFASSPSPIDVATQTPITLECLPCRNLCKSCVAGLILDPNGNKCVRECPLGFTAQKNDSTGQVTCVAAVIQAQDATKVTLETKVHLESRLPELVRGFTVQNLFQRTKLAVKNSLPDQKLVHTLQLSAVYLLGKGEEREQVPENLLQTASKEILGEFAATISTSFKVDENTIFLPANFFQSNYIYKLTVVSTQLAADGKTVEAESSASTLVAVVERDTFVKLESDTATISVASEKLNALDKQCASLVIRDLINYSTSDQFLVSISYRQAYVESKDTMEPNQVTESSLENVFCFNAPFVQVQTNFQVNFQLSLNGVHRTGVRFFTVLPPRDTAAVDNALTAKLKEASDLADTTDATKSTEKAIPQTQFLDLVSIITVKTEDTVKQTVTQVKPTDTVPTTVEAKPTDVLCSTEQPEVSCNNNGKCVLNQNVPVCECKTGFDPVTNCKEQWTTDQDAQITQSNEQLLTVLKAANKQSTVSTTVNSDQKLSDSVKVEITAQILNVPIKDVAVVKEAVKLLTTLTSSPELPAQQVLQALSTGVRTVQKLLRTPQQQVGGRFLTEQEIDKEEQLVQADVALALDKVCDKLEVDNNREDTEVSEVVSEVYNLRVAQVNPISDPKIQKIAQEIAAQDEKGQRIISRLPREIFDGQQNAAVRTFTQSKISAKSQDGFISDNEFTIKVSEDNTSATGGAKRILTKVNVANLAQPAEFCFDTTQLEAQAKELQQNIQFQYLNRDTNTWVNDPQVTFNPATQCGEAKHFSTFSVGLGDTAITDGTSSDAVKPTDGTTGTNSTNPNPQTKPEAIGVNSNLISSFIALFATITLFFVAF